MRLRTTYLLLFSCWLASACTTVRVEGTEPKTASYFGITKLEFNGLYSNPVAVQTTGFGIILGARSTTIGWLEEQLVTAPDASACQIFIFPRNREEGETLKAALITASAKFSNVCILGAIENEIK
jgi:hypothetical protein